MLHKIAKLTGMAIDIQKHKEARAHAKQQWRKERKDYYSKLGVAMSNSKQYWKSVKSVYGSKTDASIKSMITNDNETKVVTNILEIAELLNKYLLRYQVLIE